MNITPGTPSSTAQQHSTQFLTALLRGLAMAAADDPLYYHRTAWYVKPIMFSKVRRLGCSGCHVAFR